MFALLIPQRKEKDILFVFPPWRGLEMWFVLMGTHGFCISVMESGQSFISILRPGEMVTLIAYLELERMCWVRNGNGAQTKEVCRCVFLRLERCLCLSLSGVGTKIDCPSSIGRGKSREKALGMCLPEMTGSTSRINWSTFMGIYFPAQWRKEKKNIQVPHDWHCLGGIWWRVWTVELDSLVQILTSTITSCVTLGWLHNLYRP